MATAVPVVSRPDFAKNEVRGNLDVARVPLLAGGPQKYPLVTRIVPNGERVFARDGRIIGDIVSIDTGGVDVVSRTVSSELAVWEKFLAVQMHSVVRIFVTYVPKDKNAQLPDEVFAGSAFMISPLHFLTAEHCVSEVTSHEGHDYLLSRIDVTAEVAAPSISCRYHGTLSRAHKAHSIPNPTHLSDSGNTTRHWEVNSDFCILTVQDSFTGPATFPAIPITCTAPKANSSSQAITVGYPGLCDLDDFKEYVGSLSQSHSNVLPQGPPPNVTKALYATMAQHFDRRIICVGEMYSPVSADAALIPHRCPTLPGTSGGLFLDLPIQQVSGTEGACITKSKKKTIPPPSVPMFSGVHLGGLTSNGHNYAYPVTIPVFVTEYIRQIILSDNESVIAFVKKHKASLRAYVMPFWDTIGTKFGADDNALVMDRLADELEATSSAINSIKLTKP